MPWAMLRGMAVGDAFGLGVVLEAKDLFSGTMQKAGLAFREVEGASSSAGRVITDNIKALGIGLALFGAGVAGLAALSAPTKAFTEFASGIAEVSTLTDEASLSVLNLSETTLKMNAAFGGGIQTQTKGLYQGISAGASNAAEATALLSQANKLAIGGVTDVRTSVDGLTSTLNAYGMSFTKAADVSDAFFVAIKSGKTTAAELSSTIGRVAPSAAALNIGFGELLASMSAITLKGLKTEEAATGLKAALANVIKPSSDATAEAARLGVKFDSTTLRAKGLKGLLDSVTSSTKFNAKSFEKLFTSVEGLNAILALTSNGSAAFESILGKMAGRAGETDKAFEKMAATTKFQGQRFEGLKENALILIGEVLEPGAAMAIRFGNALLEGFNNLPDGVRSFLVKGFALVSLLLTVVGGAIAVKAAFGILSAGLAAAGVTASGFLATLWPVALALAAVGLAVEGFRVAWDKNIGGLADKVRAGVTDVRLVLGALGQLFDDGGISGAVRDDLNKAENAGLKVFVKQVWLFANRVLEAYEGVKTGFSNALAAAGPSIDAFVVALKGLGDAISKAFDKLDPKSARAKFDDAGAGGRKLGDTLGKVAILIVDAATAFVKLATAMTPIVLAVGGVIEGLGGVKTVAKALELVLVVLAARAAVQAAASLLQMGLSGGTAAIGIARAAAATAAMNGVSLTSGAAGVITGLKGITSAAAGALGPIGAATAAVAALYLAYDQYTKLDKELGEHGWSDMWKKLKNDLTIETDTQYQEGLGIVTGADYDKQLAAKKAAMGGAMTPIVPPPAAFTPPAGGYATPSGAAAMYGPDALAAAVEAAKGPPPAPPKPGPTYVTVKIDGKDIRAQMSAGDRADADASGLPGIPVAD